MALRGSTVCLAVAALAGIAAIGFTLASNRPKKKKRSPRRRSRTASPTPSTLVSHPLRTFVVSSGDPRSQDIEVAVVSSSAIPGMSEQSSDPAAVSTPGSTSLAFVESLKSYFVGFMPPSVPLPRYIFAAELILRTASPLLLELQALELCYPNYDLNPVVVVGFAQAAVACSRAAIVTCPKLATPEVTAVLTQLASTAHRAFRATCRPRPEAMRLEDPRFCLKQADSNTSTSTAIVIVVQQTPALVLGNSSDRHLWDSEDMLRQQKSFLKAVCAYFNSFMPAPVPVSRVVFAAAEILRTLAPIPEALLAIQAGAVLDINPKHTLTLAEIAVYAMRTSFKACPTLATIEVTITTAAVSWALRKAKKIYASTFCPLSIIEDITEETLPLLLEATPPADEPTTFVSSEDAPTAAALVDAADPPALSLLPSSEPPVSTGLAPTAEFVPYPALILHPNPAPAPLCVPTPTTLIPLAPFKLPAAIAISPPNCQEAYNDGLHRHLVGVANASAVEAHFGVLLRFSNLAVCRFRAAKTTYESVVRYALAHPAFMQIAEVEDLRYKINRIDAVVASYQNMAYVVPEMGSEPLIFALKFIWSVSRGSIPCTAHSLHDLQGYGRFFIDAMAFGDTARASGEVGMMDRLLQSVAGGCLALGAMHELLSAQPHLIDGPIGEMFQEMFDGVMREVGVLDMGAVEHPGNGMVALSSETGRCVVQNLSFVADAARSGSFIPTLRSWVVAGESGYQRSSQDPSGLGPVAEFMHVLAAARALATLPMTRCSSGVTSGQSTPLSQAGAVAPSVAPTSPAKSRFAGGNGNHSNGRRRRGRRRGSNN